MTDKLMDQPITNRWTGEVMFTAKIAADETTPLGVRIGLAVKWAIKTDANLADANLAGAILADANLAGAFLAGAYLANANLARAYLAGANLANAYLADAFLVDAYLANANLASAYLANADLANADLADANLARAYLADADLADAKNYIPERTHALAALPYLPGKLQAFKLVNEDGEGHANGGIKYPVGEVVEEPDADRDPSKHCAAGLNVADLPWVLREWCEGCRVLVVEFEAADIACVPLGTDGKFRLTRLRVVSDITDQLRANGVFGSVDAPASEESQ